MLTTKRVLIATLFGLIFGFVCWGLAFMGGETTWYLALSIIVSRTVMGFAIGLSAWRLGWWLHGILLGAIFSVPMGISGFFTPEKAWFIFIWSIVMGVIYGFLIELFTTVVFKAKAPG